MDRLTSTYMDELANGQLVNLSMSDTGHIRLADQPRVINCMNMALLRLFTLLKLRENETTIICHTHITDYKLDSKYSIMHGDPAIPYRYIFDPFHKFSNDVIKVISVFDDEGRDRPLNNYRNPFAVFTPNPTTIQIPVVVQDEPITVRYQATHPKLVNGNSIISLGATNLDLPFSCLVSYFIFMGIGSPEAIQQAGLYAQEATKLIEEMKLQGHYIDDGYDESRDFYYKGWR